MIDYNMDIQDAIDCARIYDNASENICYESGGVNPITPEVAKELQDRGHEVTDKGEWQLFFGGVQESRSVRTEPCAVVRILAVMVRLWHINFHFQ